jgi:hypothetical protein
MYNLMDDCVVLSKNVYLIYLYHRAKVEKLGYRLNQTGVLEDISWTFEKINHFRFVILFLVQ